MSISPPVALPEMSTMGAATTSAVSEAKTNEYLMVNELRLRLALVIKNETGERVV